MTSQVGSGSPRPGVEGTTWTFPEAKPRTAQGAVGPPSPLLTSVPQEQATWTPASAPASLSGIWPLVILPFLWPAPLGRWHRAPGSPACISKETALCMRPQTCTIRFSRRRRWEGGRGGRLQMRCPSVCRPSGMGQLIPSWPQACEAGIRFPFSQTGDGESRVKDPLPGGPL